VYLSREKCHARVAKPPEPAEFITPSVLPITLLSLNATRHAKPAASLSRYNPHACARMCVGLLYKYIISVKRARSCATRPGNAIFVLRNKYHICHRNGETRNFRRNVPA